MKKHVFKPLFCIALAIWIASLLILSGSALTSGCLTYTVNGVKASVTECDTSAAGEIEIPLKIEGYVVRSIDSNAFRGCTGVTGITIPKYVTSIGHNTFYGCSNLTSINIPNGVTSIGNSVFSGCSNLKSITIPDGVTSIGNNAFSRCSSLTSITIPDSVTSIGEYAFDGCSGLTEIKVTSGNPVYHSAGNCLINTVNKELVAGCRSSVIPDDGSVTSIGSGAFSGCSGLTSITIPDSVKSVGSFAFYNCSNLASIIIPDSVTLIDSHAFDECTGLANITIPGSVKSIGNLAFYRCSGLTSITIQNGVTSIGINAFRECRSLTGVTIPDSVTSIGNYVFNGCVSLTEIEVTSGNTVYHSAGNCLIKTASKELIAGCQSSVIPSDGSVTSIKGAFPGCRNLTSITIPDGVTLIGDSAFAECRNLTSITIPDSVTSIGDEAFRNCTNLNVVWYSGSAEQWKKIKIGSKNDCLKNASVYDPSFFTTAKFALSDSAFTASGDFVTVNLTVFDLDFTPCGLTASILWDPDRFACEEAKFGPGIHSSATKTDNAEAGKITFEVARQDGVLSSDGGALYVLTLKVLPGAEKENTVSLLVESFGPSVDENYASVVSIQNATVRKTEKLTLIAEVSAKIKEAPQSGGVTMSGNTLEEFGSDKTENDVRSLLTDFSGAEIAFKNPDGTTHDPSRAVGTGTVIELLFGGTVIDSLTVIVKGDGDGNGSCDVFDAVTLLGWIVSPEKNPLSDCFRYALNADGSPSVDVFDAVSILTYIVMGGWID